MLRAGDHPRSRGVYEALEATFWDRKGSSPLARGLLFQLLTELLSLRIIPARAGFTHAHALLHGGPEDHPRSRGVYSVLR